TVNLFDVDQRKDLPDRLPRARYFGISIKPDRSGFFYTRFEKQGPRVYFHALGTDPAGDREVFGQGYGPEKIISASLSEDGRYLLITVMYGSAAMKSELYVQDVARQGPIVPVVKDLDARFQGHIVGDHLFMQTNWQAPNGRVLEVDLKIPERDR